MDCAGEGAEDGREVWEDLQNVWTDKVALNFIDCIIQDEHKAYGNIVLSCIEAA